VQVDVGHHQLAHGDRLLLCTDGLTELLSEVEIAALLDAHPRPDDACRALVGRALDCGGLDNVTVVLASYAISEVDDTAEWPARPD
jgi:protein phosphatase